MKLKFIILSILCTSLFNSASSPAKDFGQTKANQAHYLQDDLPYLTSVLPLYKDEEEARYQRGMGALTGLATGDAVGVALEAASRPTRVSQIVTDMVGNPSRYGGMRPGEWTDDTSMALALGESLINWGDFKGKDILQKWDLWRRIGYLNVKNFREDRSESQKYERAFDIGHTTLTALAHHQSQPEEKFPGAILSKKGHSMPANGSIMRLAPVAIFYHASNKHTLYFAKRQSLLTHGHPASVDASTVMAHMLFLALKGASKEDVLLAKGFDFSSFGSDPISQRIQSMFSPHAPWRNKLRSQLILPPKDGSGGSAEFTLECSLWAISKSDNFKDAILLAINLGRDADTVGAVTGQIAGALYGIDNIPIEWRRRLIRGQKIELMGRTLIDAGKAFFERASARAAGGNIPEPFRRKIFLEPQIDPEMLYR